ncbi:MAG: aldo/keto reductase [Ignavibacteriaceae bacterium]
MNREINYKIKLNNGIEIPQLGLGVYQTEPSRCTDVCLWAFEAGYRHFDTAAAYGNEKEVGQAIKMSGIPREEIFITTKLKSTDHGYETALKAFDKSLKTLGLEYIDLYLIHWPGSDKRKESWKALEKIYESGMCKAIGVSNYMMHHLSELFGYANIVPAVNQIEFHLFLYLKELLEFNNQNHIAVEAYSPLAKMKRSNNKVIKGMMQKYSKSYSQIMIRWCLQHNLITIPKSANRNRIIENANVFDFDIFEDDMKILNKIDEGIRFSWDPMKIK